jgi:hypothetical protein
MDAYDEGSNGRHGLDAPDGPAPGRGDSPSAPDARKATDASDVPSAPENADSAAVSSPSASDLPNASGTPKVPDGPADQQQPVHQTSAGQAPPPGRPTPAQPFAAEGAPAIPAPTGIAALSLGYQIAAAFALAVVALTACVHLGMVFLHLAPSNTVTKQHGRAIEEWIYPEFEQNWKLFAPNPLQQNIAVQVRAQVRTPDGASRETGWYDLSALDGAAIDGNLLPSHTQQNELRRSWDFYVNSHDGENRPTGLRGDLSERYLRRIVVLRLDRLEAGGKGAVVESVQVRSLTTSVTPPKWSEEQVSDKPAVRELPWWSVPAGDRQQETSEASAR